MPPGASGGRAVQATAVGHVPADPMTERKCSLSAAQPGETRGGEAQCCPPSFSAGARGRSTARDAYPVCRDRRCGVCSFLLPHRFLRRGRPWKSATSLHRPARALSFRGNQEPREELFSFIARSSRYTLRRRRPGYGNSRPCLLGSASRIRPMLGRGVRLEWAL